MHVILRPSVILLAAVLAGGFFVASQQIDMAQSGPQAEMALVVDPAGTPCMKACTVPLNGNFTLAVDIVTAPVAGYVTAQTVIDYGDDLIYDIDEQPAAVEIVWADLEPRTALKASFGGGLVTHGGLSGLFPPLPASADTGNFVEIKLTCSADDSSTKIELLPFGDQQSFTAGGTSFGQPDGLRIVPILGSIQIDCGAGGPLDTPTPTATQTPLPTATPTPTPTPIPPSVGDVNCDTVVNGIDAALILQLHAALLSELPCPRDSDVNGDGLTNSVDAALIMQYATGLIATLPP